MDDEPRPSEPPPRWSPPPEPGDANDPARRFFNGVAVQDLGLGDAISTGFRVLSKWNFLVPVLVVSVIVTFTLITALGPIIRDQLVRGSAALDGRMSIVISSAIVAIIGSLFAATYGQVWLIAATSGPEPSIGEALRRSLDRWLAVLGSGFLSGLILVFASLPLAFLLGRGGSTMDVVLVLVFVPPLLWLGARLTFATWLAADGRGPIESVRQSWQMTRGLVLRVIGWRLAYGLLIAAVGLALGLVLDRFALGTAINQGIALAIEFGATIALYRKVEADAPGIAP